LIGAETYRSLPVDAEVEPRPGLVVKGKQARVDAYVLNAVPSQAFARESHVYATA
jgi:hypothetical protein